MAGNPPVDVQRFGQSIWYDNIHRSLLRNGELQELIDHCGVLGVTSNPTIFQKAISSSDAYNDAIASMLDLDAEAIYEQLALDDVRAALDMLRPVYDRTGGRDGYVSLEVSPLIAHDSATTVAEAKRLFAVLGRPNAMIKIPATVAGIPAIEEAIAAGINVNVTLIFGLENYYEVAEAYIRGLERRRAAGEDVTGIASVASFFLSRIDTMVDKMLDNNIRAAQGRDIARVALNNKLKGKTAIASAKAAYAYFRSVFYGERFAALKADGAMLQQLLWASTGTKNPAYPDTLYVDNLIGRDTVNTLPPKTLTAFKDHGAAAPTLEENIGDAKITLDMLAEVGIDLAQITARLQQDGVEAFVESFSALIEQIEARRNVLQTGVIREQENVISGHHADVESAIHDLESEHTNARLWNRDGTLWRDHPVVSSKIAGALGWLDPLALIDFARLQQLSAAVKDHFKAVVWMGMGGSAQPAVVYSQAFGVQPDFPVFYLLNTTDPDEIAHVEAAVDLKHTLFVAASKSGVTFETLALFRYFYEKTGQDGSQFVAVTTANSPLDQIAQASNFREVFHESPDSLGSYSALGYVGWVPAALLGIDFERLRTSVERMLKASSAQIIAASHPGISLGAVLGAVSAAGQDKLTVFTSPSIAAFTPWVEHLIAESTGKEGRSILPVTGGTVGKPHDYSTDRLFIYIRVEDDDNTDLDGEIMAMQGAGHPVITLRLRDEYALPGEFFRWMYAAVIAAKLFQVNPFDSPNINEGRQIFERLLEDLRRQGTLPAQTPLVTDSQISLFASPQFSSVLRDLAVDQGFDAKSAVGLLAAQLNATTAGDFFAILTYLPPTDLLRAAQEDARRRLRHSTRRAIALSYGPEYLHNTGQLYKGSGKNGVFIVITADNASHLSVPGEPFSFSDAHLALALSDVEALQSQGYRVLRLHGTTPEAAIKLLSDAVNVVMKRRA